MIFELKNTKTPQPGDFLVSKDGKLYLIAEIGDKKYPYSIIDMQTGKEVNGYSSLDNMRTISVSAGPIARIIRNSEVKLVEL
jgi:hypothetical protein